MSAAGAPPKERLEARPKARLGVLISGRGSNMEALLAASAAPDFPAEIAIVLSDNAAAAGLATARAAGIPISVVEYKPRMKLVAEDALTAALRAAGVDLVCLAGFMRLLGPGFVAEWRDRLVNIHPSLLPSFPGLDTHVRALAAGVRIHGCTVHYVRAGMDDGPIIGQAAVPVLPDDDEPALAARVLAAEHRLYPACVRAVVEGRVAVTGERARLTGVAHAPALIFMPPA